MTPTTAIRFDIADVGLRHAIKTAARALGLVIDRGESAATFTVTGESPIDAYRLGLLTMKVVREGRRRRNP